MIRKYTSTSYSKVPPEHLDAWMEYVSSYSAQELLKGYSIICPLTMGHQFIKLCLLPNDSDWWLLWCYNLLITCNEMDVLMIDGWDESYGVIKEIDFAEKNGIKINYIPVSFRIII